MVIQIWHTNLAISLVGRSVIISLGQGSYPSMLMSDHMLVLCLPLPPLPFSSSLRAGALQHQDQPPSSSFPSRIHVVPRHV